MKPEQIEKLKEEWKALNRACWYYHDLFPRKRRPYGRDKSCLCRKEHGTSEACTMLGTIKHFFKTVDLDNIKSWERSFVEALKDSI